jgi:hypothetical protein
MASSAKGTWLGVDIGGFLEPRALPGSWPHGGYVEVAMSAEVSMEPSMLAECLVAGSRAAAELAADRSPSLALFVVRRFFLLSHWRASAFLRGDGREKMVPLPE